MCIFTVNNHKCAHYCKCGLFPCKYVLLYRPIMTAGFYSTNYSNSPFVFCNELEG
uniref:Uncharacterized protein n=1 Tax=Anguilla anguilla TaxID=7936 RepID=A0A0E9XEZ1_ANGAN